MQPSESSSRWSEHVEWSTPKSPARAIPLPQGSMMAALQQVEGQILGLLAKPDIWRSLDVTYHPPRVERVFTDLGEWRVSLHCIHPCKREEALFHPHPWPSAMRILSGTYEMAVGYASGNIAPPIAATLHLPTLAAYEMVEPDAWHFVRPLGGPAMTLMVTATPWERSTPRSNQPLFPLSEERKLQMIEHFRTHYAG